MATKKVNITPVSGTKNRVFVTPTAPERISAGGIIIPDTAQEKPQKGTVIAISESDEDGKKPIVKVGDVVWYGKYAGQEMTLDGVEYLVMRESDIIGKLSK